MAPILAQRPRTDRSFERLYERHVGDVYRYSLAVLRNPADAEDVTQTTFLNAYRAYQRGDRPSSPQNWLIKIAHNVCRQRFRTSARRPHEIQFDEDVGAAIVEDDDTPTAQDIQRALGQLAFNQRAALVMRELEGRSYAEIGEILNLSVSAVETLIFRARRALREQLEGALTCHEAELAISKQLDGRLPRAEKGALRAHLRECAECATFARSQRAQRSALKALGAIPVPGSLASFFGGGSSVGTGILALKAGAIAAAFVAAGAATSTGIKHSPWHKPTQVAAAAGAPAAPREQPDVTVGGSLFTPRPKVATIRLAPSGGKARHHAPKAAAPRKAEPASHGSSQSTHASTSAASQRGNSAAAHARHASHSQARTHARGNSSTAHANRKPKSRAKPAPTTARRGQPARPQQRPAAPPQSNRDHAKPKPKDVVPTPPALTVPTPPVDPGDVVKKPKK